MDEIKNKCISAIMGLVVGDALGVPVEFTDRKIRKADPVKEMRSGGCHRQPVGTWSDDSSMVLVTMDWYISGDGEKLNYTSLMQRFWNWLKKGEFTATGITFDRGGTVEAALVNFESGALPLNCGPKDKDANGNGSLMRILPVALVNAKELYPEIWNPEPIYDMSALTHGHGRSKLGCLIYSVIVAELMYVEDNDKYNIVKQSIARVYDYLNNQCGDGNILREWSHYNRLSNIDEFMKLDDREIKSSGYVVDTLEAAIWCFLTTDSYKECVLKAVNLGSDTDTVGAVAGGLAGLYYGMDDIPAEWLAVIARKDWILEVSEEFCNKCIN